MVGKDLIMATLFGSGGGSGGGGIQIANGTLIPVAPVEAITHGLGVVPDVVVWYVSDTTLESTRNTVDLLDTPETIIKTTSGAANLDGNRMMAVYTPDVFASTQYATNSDWGFFTLTNPANEKFAKHISVNEQEIAFPFDHKYIIPYWEDGSCTVTWFAISGVTL